MSTDDDSGSNELDDEPSRPPWLRSWATVGLVAVNASVFLAMVLAGASPFFTSPADAMAAGGIDPRRVWDGEVWRLITACFVHLGVWHLALNMWVLWQLGRALERMVGSARLVLVYLTSGAFGFALSVAATARPTAGASGAVFGVTGGLLAIALLLRHKELGKLIVDALLPFIIATLVLGLLVPMVDNSAHVGGLVFGFLVCFGMSAGDRSLLRGVGAGSSRTESVLGGVALVASALLFLGVCSYAARPIWSPLYLARRGLEALQAGDLEDADAHARAAARIAPKDGATFVLLGRLEEERTPTAAGRAEAARLAGEGLRRYDDADVPAAFRDAQVALMLIGGGGTEDLPFHDHRTVNLLCDAAVPMLGPPAPTDDDAFARADVRNECAWLKVKSGDARVYDAATGLALARAAVGETRGEVMNHVHTLAEALSRSGEVSEALALLEKIAAEGRAAELPGGAAFLESERRRIRQLLADDRTRTPPAPAIVPASGALPPAPSPAVPDALPGATPNGTAPGQPR